MPSLRISTDSDAIASSTASQILLGTFEASELRCTLRFLPLDLPVVELGCGIGVVSSAALRRGISGPLIGVEANLSLHPLVRRNWDQNNPKGVACRLIPGVIGTQGENLSFTVDPDSHLGSRLSPGAGPVSIGTSLDEVVDGLKEYALICDIEGAEVHFIMGDCPALERCRTMIIELHDSEWNGTAISTEELVARLATRGFAQTHQDGSVHVFTRP